MPKAGIVAQVDSGGTVLFVELKVRIIWDPNRFAYPSVPEVYIWFLETAVGC